MARKNKEEIQPIEASFEEVAGKLVSPMDDNDADKITQGDYMIRQRLSDMGRKL